MIRTTLSFCALFGCLIFLSKWLSESVEPRAETTATPAAAPAADIHPQPAALPTATQTDTLPSATEEQPQQAAAATQSLATASVEPTCQELPVCGSEDSTLLFVSYGEDEEYESELTSDEETEEESAEDPSDRDPLADLVTLLTDTPITKQPAETTEPAKDSAAATPPSSSDEELSPELIELRGKIRECLAHYYFRPENVAIRSPWGAMHAMIAYGVDTQLIAGDRRVNAIGYLNYNGVCNGQSLFYIKDDKLQARIGVGVQGHAGQYLAMLAQSRVKTDFPLKVEGRDFTVADLIEHEKLTCRPNSELTFKLIALTHYLKSDEKWKSDDGQDWDIPRLIKEELKQPIIGAACGGTHRMTGFSYAVRKREQRNEPIEGQWKRAKTFVEDYHEYAFKLQNPDGSFSTDWFAGRADFGPPSRRLETTGHITEWLAFSLSKEQLQEPRMIKSVDYLTDLLLNGKNEKWGIGPLGHGLHALAIYDERVFGGKPGAREEQLAEVKKSLAR